MTDRKLFQVVIEETVSEHFDVYANNMEEAIKIAEDQYNKGQFNLSPGNLIDKKLFVIDKDFNLEKEWTEF
ncbi:MAG: DpnD/PcfM family protein [Lachnospiraceae bacterium]|nr:DpnD/PcfM family protein [Lachnospiraceae bacterium]